MAIKDTLVTDGIYQGWTLDDYIGPTGGETYYDVHYGSHGSDASVQAYYYCATSGHLTTVSGTFEPSVSSSRHYKPGVSGNTYHQGYTNVLSGAITSDTAFSIECFIQIDQLSSWANYATGSGYNFLSIGYGYGYILGTRIRDNSGTMEIMAYAETTAGELQTGWLTLEEGRGHIAATVYASGGDIYLKLWHNYTNTATNNVTASFNTSAWSSYNYQLSVGITPYGFSSTAWYDFTVGDYGWYRSQLSDATVQSHYGLLGPRVRMDASGSFDLDQWFMAYINDPSPPKSLQVEADISGCATSSLLPGLFLRYQDQGTFYIVMLNKDTSKWDLVLMDSGTKTTLASSSPFTITDQDYHVCLYIVDDSLKVTVDNVEVISTTNSAISAAGKYGISYRG